MSAPDNPYRGRFAPSPTGPLHLGSLIAALASYLDARYHGGTWLVRIDDLDPPREQPGAAQNILQSLESHGLLWDEELMWQSRRREAYDIALATLAANHETFYCSCSRSALGKNGSCAANCRQVKTASPCSIRINVAENSLITFEDGLQSLQCHPLDSEYPDFTIRRKDGLYAYQLAVAVDDAQQGITHIVRGSDLMDSTARQIYLQQRLGYPTPNYCHVPVITNALGQKFSKQNHAPALDNLRAEQNLRAALAFLQQDAPPTELRSCPELLKFAREHWSITRIPQLMAVNETASDGI